MTARAKPKLAKLMTVRMISDELGVPLRTAQTIFGAIARQTGVIRLPGVRRVFVMREDVERYITSAGAMTWL